MRTFADRSHAKATDQTTKSNAGRDPKKGGTHDWQLALAQLHGASAKPASRSQSEANFQKAFASRGAPIVQTKSARVGPSDDIFEQEADRVAEEVTQSNAAQPATPPRLHHGPSGVLRRHPSLQGSALSSGMQTQVGELGGGSHLPTTVRQKFESKFSADFSGVRVHTGSSATAMNQSLHSRAFTTGQDIFFGKGEYQPETPQGQKVLAHELTHVGQQNPAILSKPLLHDQTQQIRPLRMNPKNQSYYSDATPGLHDEYKVDTTNDAFLTATSTEAVGGGHTVVYLEYFEQTTDAPQTKRVDLFVNHGNIDIQIKDYTPGRMQEYLAGLSAGRKKTWKKTRTNALAALQEALTLQADQANYSYWTLGKGMWFTKKNLNCARFGQRVLQAGGVDIHIGSPKLPKDITDPRRNNTNAIANVYSTADLEPNSTSQLPGYCRDAAQFLTTAQVANTDRNSRFLGATAKSLQAYHTFEETSKRAPFFIDAANQLAEYVKYAGAEEFVDSRSNGPTAVANVTLAWLRTDFYNRLRGEHRRLALEIGSDKRALRQAGLAVTELDFLSGQIDAAMAKLTTLMRYTTTDAMVRGRVNEHFTDKVTRTVNTRMVNKILNQGGVDAIAAHWA